MFFHPSQKPGISYARIGDGSIQTVNARELHEFLEVSTRFNDWIRNRISDFNFTENQDFVSLTENLVSGGKRTEYHLSLDMAKELSMVERTEKGELSRTGQTLIEYHLTIEAGKHIGMMSGGGVTSVVTLSS